MTLAVTHTEYAGGGPGYALVRLTGAARAAAAPPTLLIADGARWRRLAAVPGTPALAAGAPFTVAFEVPLHLALGDGAWWLEPGPELAVRDPRLDDIADRVAALGAEIAALRARITEDQEPEPPTPDAVPVPRRGLLRGRRPGLPALLVATGALALGDAVATVAWQEPVSAVWAAHEQHGLQGDLARLDAAYASPAARASTSTSTSAPPTAQARIRALAHTLESRTATTKPLGEIAIPRIGEHAVIVQGTTAASLRRGPGHYYGTALPGQPGTVGIAGHRTTYGAPFRHLDALRRGDPITITMPYGRFTYRVEGTRIVKPSDVSALTAIGRQRLVLTACHPLYSAAQRLVVIARLTQATPRGAASAGPAAPGGADAA